VLLLIPLFHHVILRRRKLILSPVVPLILSFVAVQVLGTLLTDRKEVAFSTTMTNLIEGLILYVLLTNVIRNRLILRRVLWSLVAVGAMLGGLSTLQQVTGNFRNQYAGFAQADVDESAAALGKKPARSRSAGPIGEKNYYAQFMLMLVPLCLVQIRNSHKRWHKAAAAIAAGLTGLGIAFTASRGAAVGFVVMLMALLILRQVRWRHALMMIAAAGVILLATPKYRERLMSIVGVVDVVRGKSDVRAIDTSTKGRLTEMLAAGLVFADHPILGVGPGNFPFHFLDKADSIGFQVHGDERMAHCSYLQIAAENGVIGLILYLSILFVTLRMLWKARREAPTEEAYNIATGFLVTMIVMMTTGIFLSMAYERFYWFMLALSAAACYAGRTTDVGDIGEPSPIANDPARISSAYATEGG
jgi:O-antigen ligase